MGSVSRPEICMTQGKNTRRLNAGLQADVVLLIFTLAALAPEDQHNMLVNAFKVRICNLMS
jgi:hypothetical protein